MALVTIDDHWWCWGETDQQQVLLSRKCAQWQCRHRWWDSVSHSESCLFIRTPAAAFVKAAWHRPNHYSESQSIGYSAAVLTILLYGGESWTVHKRHIKQLESFHVRCLRKILNVHWQYKIPDTEILERSHCVSIQAMLIHQQLRWTGYVCRMEDYRLPKRVLYGELSIGSRCMSWGPTKALQGSVKEDSSPLQPWCWQWHVGNCCTWPLSLAQFKSGVQQFELRRNSEAKGKWQRRKEAALLDLNGSSPYICHICGRVCGARIGLLYPLILTDSRHHSCCTATTTVRFRSH